MSTDPMRWLWAFSIVGLWLLVCWRPWWLKYRHSKQISQSALITQNLISYASQSGSAHGLAQKLWQQFTAIKHGQTLPPLTLESLTPDLLARTQRACFIVSTTGSGAAPDHAQKFVSQMMSKQLDLHHLHYSLVALGDQSYEAFCEFGRQLHSWLQRCGAQAQHPPFEVDRLKPATLNAWQRACGDFFGLPLLVENVAEEANKSAQVWHLADRKILNPSSPGAPIFNVLLQPTEAIPNWQAGDIVQVAVPDPTGTIVWRDYTLASLPESGHAQLLIRQTQLPDGRWGLGTGWLGRQLHLGDQLRLRIRSNPNFHAPASQTPMILIGHGTGLAGLVVHLRARTAQASSAPSWLLYGERCPQQDRHLDTELQAMLQSGVLSRLNCVYSRNTQSDARYVQELITLHAASLTDWLQHKQAVIYVCGRRDTMGKGVHQALEKVLGKEELALLTEQGRYRRDVY